MRVRRVYVGKRGGVRSSSAEQSERASASASDWSNGLKKGGSGVVPAKKRAGEGIVGREGVEISKVPGVREKGVGGGRWVGRHEWGTRRSRMMIE